MAKEFGLLGNRIVVCLKFIVIFIKYGLCSEPQALNVLNLHPVMEAETWLYVIESNIQNIMHCCCMAYII
jgi:hypothetical protein